MTRDDQMQEALNRLTALQRRLSLMFAGRDEAVRLLILAVVCREHLLLLGPPGTAKTEIITRFAEAINTRPFVYLMTRFTEPAELFGTVDWKEFRQGRYQVRTENMLPSAEIAFLDDVFHGSGAILNSLLSIMSERVFHNGARLVDVPLKCLIAASNEIPEDSALRAVADRFLLRCRVDAVAGPEIRSLVDKGWQLERKRMSEPRGDPSIRGEITMEALSGLHSWLATVTIDSTVLDNYAHMIRRMKSEGVELSDRRVVKSLKLVGGAALLRRDRAATEADFWPLAHIWTNAHEAAVVAAVVREYTHGSESGGGHQTPPEFEREELELQDQFRIRHNQLQGALLSYSQRIECLIALNGISRRLKGMPLPPEAELQTRQRELTNQVRQAIQKGLDDLHQSE